jgi:hypothetical protein
MHLAAQYNARPGLASAVESLYPRPWVVKSPPGGRSLKPPSCTFLTSKRRATPRIIIRPSVRSREFPLGPDAAGREANWSRRGSRATPGPFTSEQIALLQTFADQAVIAIENVRLFKELESSNRELRVALERQTATSELLKVIGRSTFELQPVFETLAENAVRLCEAERAFIFRFDGEVLRVAATHNVSPARRAFAELNPIRPGRHSAGARAALERARSTFTTSRLIQSTRTRSGRPTRLGCSVSGLRRASRGGRSLPSRVHRGGA